MNNQIFSDQSEATYLFFDAETTGLFNFGTELLPETTFLFPHVVQLAWQLRNKSGHLLAAACDIVRPVGFTIPPASVQIHGISHKRALAEGEPASLVFTAFAAAIHDCDFLVAHNFDYDSPICGAEFLRLGRKNPIPHKPAHCTNKQPTGWAKLPKNGKRGYSAYRWPSLAELHRLCGFGEIPNAHDASADVEATARCFFHILQTSPEVFDAAYA
jgi:DNA polymerase III epsilon subunit-like protein